MITLTCEQVRRVDQLAVERYAMPSIILMENAAGNAARITLSEFRHLSAPVVGIFCGPGNNGGDGFAMARHLHNAGWKVRIVLAVPADKLKGDALVNYEIARHMNLPIHSVEHTDQIIAESDIIIDALLGTGFQGAPRAPLDSVIQKINASAQPVVAVDVPSGLDCFSGAPAHSTIRATITITFVAAKTAFLAPTAIPFLGKLHIADIGVPRELIDEMVGAKNGSQELHAI